MDIGLIKKLNPHLLFSGYINKNNIVPNLAKYPERIVKWYELEFVVWGNGYVDTNGEKIPAIENTVFIRYPGMKVQGYLPYSSYLLVFDLVYNSFFEDNYSDENFTSAIEMDLNKNNVVFSQIFPHQLNYYITENISPVRSFFKDIHRLNSLDFAENALQIKILILQLVMHIEEDIKNKMRADISRKSILYIAELEKIKTLIENNPDDNFSLKQLADIANLSPNFLCKLFSDTYKISLFKYINKCRIDLSKSLLSETSKSISEISLKCGFENDTYFYRVFKQQTGLTPNLYRNRSNVFDWE